MNYVLRVQLYLIQYDSLGPMPQYSRLKYMPLRHV